ncbi:KICSTOR complex protein ITFG2 isoform X1 [Halyomorpha halys]|uniref:KICSTOR complex protein ITFG2 isoform X1 n=1 Tax=Halyomorpha halys TaxID=286706 RepID=UPI0006D4E9D8|nr:KICSTOR complex protein ITFG2-like isoform X1 [Halyomorpha halys]
MRSVCFVDKIELDFSGNILADAIALGDIDNDGENELVVGTINGELSIFKGEKLWQTIFGLGMIASVGVGDIMNCGSNAVVAISGEGWCHFYMCINQNKPNICEKLQLVYQRRIPTNAKVMVLGDIQGDGQTDLIVGLTDRVVRIYRWLQTREVASLVCLNKCECASQIGSICIGKDIEGKPCVLVSQPGATYMTISNSQEENPLVEYHEVPLPKLTCSSISSQIVGCVGNDSSIGVVSLDGTVSYISKQKLLWTINVEQQLFTAGKVSVCNEGGEQIVTSAWSGHTFIIDTQSNIVCFEVGQAIQSFISGIYANNKSTSFIYVTYSNKIFVYFNIEIERMVLYSLYALQANDPELSMYTRQELKEITEYCLYHEDSDDKKTSDDKETA